MKSKFLLSFLCAFLLANICFADDEQSSITLETRISGTQEDLLRYCDNTAHHNDFEKFACRVAIDPVSLENEPPCKIVSLHPLTIECPGETQSCGVTVWNPWAVKIQADIYCLTWNPKPRS